jgi:ribA/ribD-fused uncharacterized protein
MTNKMLNGLKVNSNNTYENDTHVFFWGSYLSNWAKYKFTHKGHTYNCSEQAMMAEKALLFQDKTTFDRIMQSSDPREQKAFGREVAHYNEEVWVENRYRIMVDILHSKFAQNISIALELEATNEKTIVESSSYDNVWGIAMHASDPDIHDESKWKGLNLLGKALMEVRQRLRDDGVWG